MKRRNKALRLGMGVAFGALALSLAATGCGGGEPVEDELTQDVYADDNDETLDAEYEENESALSYSTDDQQSVLKMPSGLKSLFYDGFESGEFPKGKKWGFSGNNTAHIVKGNASAGSHAVRMELDKNDPVVYRSEIVNPALHFKWGEEQWMKFSHRIEKVETLGGIVWQLHGIPVGWKKCTANMPIIPGAKGWMYNSLIYINAQANGDLSFNIQGRGNGVAEKSKLRGWYLGKWKPNQWRNWVVHFKLSPKDDGFFEVYLDGKLMVNHHGKNVDTFNMCHIPNAAEHYAKMGIYSSGRKSMERSTLGPVVIDYDEIERLGR